MSVTLGHLAPNSGVLACMDDLICISPTFEAHLQPLERMFSALHAAGLTLKPSKVQFGLTEVENLGHVISAKGIAVSSERIEVIQELPTPTCTKYLRSVSDMLNFVRRFVKYYAELTAPLINITRKDFVLGRNFKSAWGPSQGVVFAKINQVLASTPAIHFPDFLREFILHIDSSEYGVEAFLA